MSWAGMRVGAWQIEAAAEVPAAGAWAVAAGAVAGRARAAGSRAPRAASERAWVSVLPPDADRIGRAGQRAAHDALARLDDPRIPVALGYFEGSGAYVVGASEGWPLLAVVEGRRDRAVALSPATLLDLVIDLCEAIGHAHQRRVVHGRLWPGCVWVAGDGHLVVWGFGAPLAAPAAWAIPDRALDEATDQWSIGALAVALVTGRPFDGTAAVDAQWPALGRVLRRMTEPVKADRFESLDAARHALIGLARRAGEASDRRALVAWLSGEPVEPEPVEAPDEASGEGMVAELDEPSDDADRSDPTEVPVPRVERPPRLEPRPARAALPEEPLPVVRPAVDEDLPVAALRPAATRTPDGAGMTFGRPPRPGRGEVAAPAPAGLSSEVDGAAPPSPLRDPAVSPTAPDGPPAPPPLEPPMPPRPLSLPIDDAPVGPPAVEIEFDETDEFAFDPPSGNGVERAQPTEPVVARVVSPAGIPVQVELDDDDDDDVMAPRRSGPALGDFGSVARAPGGPMADAAANEAPDDGLAFGSTQPKPVPAPFQAGKVAMGLVVVMLVMMVLWFVVRGVG